MVRKAARKRARGAPRRAPAPPTGAPRERIIQAFMQLLAEQPFERIGLSDIAARANVSLAELRSEFSSPLAILAAHIKELDRKVLSETDSEMEEESPRERLFDVLMRRLELLAPHRQAVRSLMRSARCDPALALALNVMTVRSQQWMLTAAGIKAAGPKGMVRAQGMACLYANLLRTWVKDDDPGLARTLAALDRELSRGQHLSGLLDELCRIPEAACRFRERMREAARRGREREDRIPA
jgi:AcrR family transcriptional regulator